MKRPGLWRPPPPKVILYPGNVTIDVHPHGDRRSVIDRRRSKNLVPAQGRNMLAYLLANQAWAPTSIGLGSDATGTVDETTDLGTERYRARIDTRDVDGSTLTFQTYIDTTEGNGYTYTEAGLFANELESGGLPVISTGTLFARTTFTGIAKTASVSFTLTWQLPIGAA